MKRIQASVRMDTPSAKELFFLILGGGAVAVTFMLSVLYICAPRANRVCAASLLCALA